MDVSDRVIDLIAALNASNAPASDKPSARDGDDERQPKDRFQCHWRVRRDSTTPDALGYPDMNSLQRH